MSKAIKLRQGVSRSSCYAEIKFCHVLSSVVKFCQALSSFFKFYQVLSSFVKLGQVYKFTSLFAIVSEYILQTYLRTALKKYISYCED